MSARGIPLQPRYHHSHPAGSLLLRVREELGESPIKIEVFDCILMYYAQVGEEKVLFTVVVLLKFHFVIRLAWSNKKKKKKK